MYISLLCQASVVLGDSVYLYAEVDHKHTNSLHFAVKQCEFWAHTTGSVPLTTVNTVTVVQVFVDDLVHYYQSVIWPVLEYACTVWHHALTKEQTQSLENIQQRALLIIFGNSPCDLSSGTLQIGGVAQW